MKKLVTLRSFLAAFVLCFSTLAIAQSTPSLKIVPIGDNVSSGMVTVSLGQESVITLHAKGENVTDDITLSFSVSAYAGEVHDQFTLSTTTLKKEDLEKADGCTFTIDYLAQGNIGMRTGHLVCESKDFAKEAVDIYIQVNAAPYANLQSLIQDIENIEGGSVQTIKGDFVVTHIFPEVIDEDTLMRAYIQDETAGAILRTYGEDVNVQVGDHFKELSVMVSQSNGETFLEYDRWSTPLSTPSYSNVFAEPITITLKEATNHIGQLVCIDELTITETGIFSENDTLHLTDADKNTAQLTLFATSDLIGKDIPTDAVQITGIIRSVAGQIILSPRGKADIFNENAPFIDCGQTGAGYMSDVAYVGIPEFAEFWVRGKNLKGDVTFLGYSDIDTEAIFHFEPATISKAKVEAGTELTSEIVRVYITPKHIGRDAQYFLEVITDGYDGDPIPIIFPEVKDTVPFFTYEVENPYEEVYVGREYSSTLYIKGNKFVKDKVYLTAPQGSDIISITPNVLSKDTVLTTFGAAVKVTFKPSKATNGDEYARTVFPVMLKTAGMKETICDYVACHVNPATPAVDITASMYGQDVFVGVPFQKTIKVKGNPFLQGDITLSKVNADDEMTFEPAVITKTAAQTEEGASVVVTITPKTVTTEMTRFYFKASTSGAADTEAYIRVWEVKETTPEVKLQVPGYIANNAMVGKNFPVDIQVIGNPFVTGDIRLSSDNEDVRLFSPAIVSADAAKAAGGAKVTVYIRPSQASETSYTNQSFIIKATTEGAKEDAEATIQFVVDANDGSGYDADPEIEDGIEKMMVNCNIWTTPNTIYFQLSVTAHVEIYNLAGQCIVKDDLASGTSSIEVQNGMYILKINSSTLKLIVK